MTNVEDKHVQIDHSLKVSVDRLVRNEWNSSLLKNLGGVKVSVNTQEEVKKLRLYCEERRFDNAVKAHNRGEKHIDLHQMYIQACSGNSQHIKRVTTAHDIMNIGRAINAR